MALTEKDLIELRDERHADYMHEARRESAERNRYRARIEALEATLLEISTPIEGKPMGNPWDFYNDVRKLAAGAIGIPYVHQEFT
ncbi:hypothetical protein [Janthinobacterium sp. NKUCC06_STL]|uniref:hypothetical protein n=1 Tax=Janthinobacterium sp. NKUCC06_STL TaxID=2842127 RepID=UPI001C5B6753|nr:hypothetical protein [Janthinobacterium sp. NKUCC06_STL]MBW3512171.1 hypothetical protein [Janthinobacterium sp. NKUCC06_STL]